VHEYARALNSCGARAMAYYLYIPNPREARLQPFPVNRHPFPFEQICRRVKQRFASFGRQAVCSDLPLFRSELLQQLLIVEEIERETSSLLILLF
jgi:hypothetical protein